MKKGKVAVVGGGLAGLMATIKIAEAGVPVDLFSLVPVKRSHSVCAQGGINGAVNTKGEGDSPWQHFDDTVYGGDFLANQPPVLAMCEAAPKIIYMLDRMGVMFNRTPEGLLDFRRFGGTLYHRTAYAGATTGQQILYALDEQVRRHEVEGLVTKYEGWEFLQLVLDEDNVCRGLIAQNMTTMEIKAFPADAVILATGGLGMIFGKSTNSMINTGSAASIAYQQGAYYANGEFIQIHPTAIPGDDKLRLMSESARGKAEEFGRTRTENRGISWKRSTRLTATWCPVTSPPGKSSMFAWTSSWASTGKTWSIWMFPIWIRRNWTSSSAASLKFTKNSWAKIRGKSR